MGVGGESGLRGGYGKTWPLVFIRNTCSSSERSFGEGLGGVFGRQSAGFKSNSSSEGSGGEAGTSFSKGEGGEKRRGGERDPNGFR